MIGFFRKKYKEIIYCLTFISIVLAPLIVQAWNAFFTFKGYTDLKHILRASTRIFNHELIYNPGDFSNDTPYLYAPYFAYLMGILKIIGHERIEMFVWNICSYLLLWLALKMTEKLLTADAPSKLPWFFHPLLLLFCFRFFLSGDVFRFFPVFAIFHDF